MRGTYALLIEVKNKTNVQIGKLGEFYFPRGFYIYVGSGQNNLEKRIKRHLRENKKIFWHIDYLLKNPKVEIREVWVKKGIRWECQLARKIAASSQFKTIISGFGSSDCKCESHLFFVLKPGIEKDFFSRYNFIKYSS